MADTQKEGMTLWQRAKSVVPMENYEAYTCPLCPNYDMPDGWAHYKTRKTALTSMYKHFQLHSDNNDGLHKSQLKPGPKTKGKCKRKRQPQWHKRISRKSPPHATPTGLEMDAPILNEKAARLRANLMIPDQAEVPYTCTQCCGNLEPLGWPQNGRGHALDADADVNADTDTETETETEGDITRAPQRRTGRGASPIKESHPVEASDENTPSLIGASQIDTKCIAVNNAPLVPAHNEAVELPINLPPPPITIPTVVAPPAPVTSSSTTTTTTIITNTTTPTPAPIPTIQTTPINTSTDPQEQSEVPLPNRAQ
ncbi:hypothetical protein Pelo_18748 [Pelomyxa schiedti]|nr:hypothetical protein Pelo_18748 [Pelomyxa schiedti]